MTNRTTTRVNLPAILFALAGLVSLTTGAFANNAVSVVVGLALFATAAIIHRS